MMIVNGKTCALLAALLLVCSAGACKWPSRDARLSEPTIVASPVEQDGQWKVASADTITLTVTAPGASTVKFLYRPVISSGRHLELKTINAPTDRAQGRFVTEWRPQPDFTGSLWAEVYYPDGTKKQIAPLALASKSAVSSAAGQPALDSMGGSLDSDESARADKLTGGRIETTPLVAGDPRIWITVNVPAFQLTLWQAGKEVKTYSVGVGRKNFPIVVGGRKTGEIIFNPEWIPPDSAWVADMEDVEPGERIEADDERNPLGKIKIPLGQGYLIHQAAKPSDLGRLVSHGCVRMLTDDLFDLVAKIVAARRLPITPEQIEQARTSTDRAAVKLAPPLWVDINYDTQVIEGGALHLYPDVYDRDQNALETLRAELRACGVDAARLDEQTLKQMLGRVSRKEEFVVSVAEIKAGRALVAGKNQPLVKTLAGRPAGQPAARQ